MAMRFIGCVVFCGLMMLAGAWQSPLLSSFANAFQPVTSSLFLSQQAVGRIICRVHSMKNNVNDGSCIIAGGKQVAIHEISLDDDDELERMSKFCIDSFYRHGEERKDSFFTSKWKDMKLAALQKAQLLDISLSDKNNNRCIFVAKDVGSGEIIGCCEVIEERLDVSQRPNTSFEISEKDRRKRARPRPVIENLCVEKRYRESGIGIALVEACENAVRQWPGYDEIFAQVEDNNTKAYGLFCRCGYQGLFVDPTCTKVVLDDALFAKETIVKKWMMRKFLDNGSGL